MSCLPQGKYTPETIKAAKLGKEKGAAVIILTWLEESEIIEFGDYIIHYTFDASPDHLAGILIMQEKRRSVIACGSGISCTDGGIC